MMMMTMMHSALKLEKSAIPKVPKNIICNFKNGKESIFAPEKSLNYQKCNFLTKKNRIFGSFKLFSGAKIDFLPFLKLQKMCFCTFESTLFFQF